MLLSVLIALIVLLGSIVYVFFQHFKKISNLGGLTPVEVCISLFCVVNWWHLCFLFYVVFQFCLFLQLECVCFACNVYNIYVVSKASDQGFLTFPSMWPN